MVYYNPLIITIDNHHVHPFPHEPCYCFMFCFPHPTHSPAPKTSEFTSGMCQTSGGFPIFSYVCLILMSYDFSIFSKFLMISLWFSHWNTVFPSFSWGKKPYHQARLEAVDHETNGGPEAQHAHAEKSSLAVWYWSD